MAHVVAVVGAAGGCGSSTVAALLARRWARHGRTVLVDLDPGGAGLEVLLGVEGAPGVRWADLAGAGSGLVADDLRAVLPTWEGVEILSEDRRATTTTHDVRGAVLDALRDGARTVVLDTSARAVTHLPDVAGIVAASPTLLMTRQDVAGVAAGLRARDEIGPPAGLALRRCPGSTVAPAEAAHVLGGRALAHVRDDPTVRGAVERGLGPTPGRATARAVERIAAALGPGTRSR